MRKELENDFLKLVYQYKSLIYKVCRFYSKDIIEIEDLYQEIVMNLWKSYPSFRNEAKISTWLYRIALNTAITYIRKEKIKTEMIEITPTMRDSLAEMEQNEMIAKLYFLVNQLSKIDRSIIFLYLEEKSHAEIATIIGCSVSNVGTKIQRIKEKMSKMNREQL